MPSPRGSGRGSPRGSPKGSPGNFPKIPNNNKPAKMLNLKFSVPCPPREFEAPPSPEPVLKALRSPCPAVFLPPCREKQANDGNNVKLVDFKHDQAAEKTKTFSATGEIPGGVGKLVCDCLSNGTPPADTESFKWTRNMNNNSEVKGDEPPIPEHADNTSLPDDSVATSLTTEEEVEGTVQEGETNHRGKRRVDPWTARKHKYTPKHPLPSEGHDQTDTHLQAIASLSSKSQEAAAGISMDSGKNKENVHNKPNDKTAISNNQIVDKKVETVSKPTKSDKTADQKENKAAEIEKAENNAEMTEPFENENDCINDKHSYSSAASSKKSRQAETAEKWLETAWTNPKYLRQMQEKIKDRLIDLYDPKYNADGKLNIPQPQMQILEETSEHQENPGLNDSQSQSKKTQLSDDASSASNKQPQNHDVKISTEKGHEKTVHNKERRESQIHKTWSGTNLINVEESLILPDTKVQHKDTKATIDSEKTYKSKLMKAKDSIKVKKDQISIKQMQKSMGGKQGKKYANEAIKKSKKSGNKIESVEELKFEELIKHGSETVEGNKEDIAGKPLSHSKDPNIGTDNNVAEETLAIFEEVEEEKDDQSEVTTSTKRKARRKEDPFNPRRHVYVPMFPLHGDAIDVIAAKSSNIEDPTEPPQLIEGHSMKS